MERPRLGGAILRALPPLRFWPSLVLLGLAAPFWVLLRGSFHPRTLRFTVNGFLTLPITLFVWSFALFLTDVPVDHVAHDLWIQLLWPYYLAQAEPMVLAWPVVWALGNLLFAYRHGATPEGGGGRFCATPSATPDRGWELLLQWTIAGGMAALPWMAPEVLPKIGLFIDPERIRVGLAVNAAAFVALTGVIWLRDGTYPGFPPGARPFRFVSRIATRLHRSEGLSRIFSRRDPALKRITAGLQHTAATKR